MSRLFVVLTWATLLPLLSLSDARAQTTAASIGPVVVPNQPMSGLPARVPLFQITSTPAIVPFIPQGRPTNWLLEADNVSGVVQWWLLGEFNHRLTTTEAFELLEPLASPLGAAALKPSPTGSTLKHARTLRFKGTLQSSALARVVAIDDQQREAHFDLMLHMTIASGPPVLMGIGSGLVVNATDFFTPDALRHGEVTPPQIDATYAECLYASGLRVDCTEQAQEAMPAPRGSSAPAVCGGTTQPCRLQIFNREGDGIVTVVLVNPYGRSAPLPLPLTFPSRTLIEARVFVLPASIANSAATVSAAPSTAPPQQSGYGAACRLPFFVWRSVSFVDPTGRATLTRDVPIGQRVTDANLPQWQIAPGATQISFSVSFGIEERVEACAGGKH